MLPVLPAAALVLALTLTQARPDPVRVMFVGDIMLDNGPGHSINSGADPFAAVAPVLRDADLAIGNLECVITREGSRVDKPFTFKGPLLALPLLKRYFSALSIANNHTGDWGREGFADQLTRLEGAGIPYFGGGRDVRAARRPLVLESKGRRIAFLGYNDFPPKRFAAGRSSPGVAWLKDADVLADVRAARRLADYVVLFLHWGEELEETPLPEQRAQARSFIDAGADAVIGSHPHVTQSVEWYRERPIVYSLGNFVFDYYRSDPPIWTGWMALLSFGTGRGIDLKITPVLIDPAGSPYLKEVPAPASPRPPERGATQGDRPGKELP